MSFILILLATFGFETKTGVQKTAGTSFVLIWITC